MGVFPALKFESLMQVGELNYACFLRILVPHNYSFYYHPSTQKQKVGEWRGNTLWSTRFSFGAEGQ